MPRGGGTGLSVVSSSGDAEGRVGEAAAAYRAPLPELAEPEEEGLPEVCMRTAACAVGVTIPRHSHTSVPCCGLPTPAPKPDATTLALRAA